MAIMNTIIGYSRPFLEVLRKTLALTGFCAASGEVCKEQVFTEEFTCLYITLTPTLKTLNSKKLNSKIEFCKAKY